MHYIDLENENQRKIKESKDLSKYLDLALEGSNIGIWDWYLTDNSVKFDKRWAEMLGLSIDEIEMKLETWESRVHPDDLPKCYEDIKKYIEGKSPQYKNIHRVRHKNGEWIYILDQGKFSDWDDKGNPVRFTGTHLDVTEQKKQELELRDAKNNAILAEKAKSRFLANMSHEIRTPMNGVLGMVDLLLESDLSDEHKDMILTIQNSGSHLMPLLNDILDFTKIESGKMELDNFPFDIALATQESMNLFKSKSEEKSLKLTFKNSLKHSWFKGDKLRIQQLLLNLISNAIKFTNKGEVSVLLNDHSVEGESFCRIELIVEDTGIGIPSERIDCLFKEFSQVDSSITKLYGGSGLGLAICKNLVGLMNGKLKVESEVNKGTIVHIELPLIFAGENTQICKEEENEKLALSENFKDRVLIVEDNSVNQKVLKRILNKLNIQYDLAQNGQESIELTRKNRYKIILMDLQMPVLNGLDTSKVILKEFKEDPPYIIAIAANVFAEDRKKCEAIGMKDFIPKPFRVKAVKDALIKYLKKSS